MSGFFGSVLSSLGSMVSSEHAAGAEGLLSTALASAGGVSGVIAKCQQAGLGAHIESWVGSGSNLPISVAEVEKIFPPDQIEAFAAQHGLPAGVASQILAQLLPHAVDAATPGGTPAS
jgi:uncharacterized protein YidB (DUF937 family)